MAKRRATVKGRARIVRLMKRLPDEARGEMVTMLNSIAPMALAAARASTPKRSGRLASALRVKVLPKSLRLNLGLLTKAARREFYYGGILDRGIKPQTVRVKRRLKGGGFSVYSLRVKALPAARFDIVYGRVSAFARNLARTQGRAAFERALRSVGGSDAID